MLRLERLSAGDLATARATFTLMADVFETPTEALGDDYLVRLLARDDFWGYSALDDDAVIAGLSAHTLWMTHRERAEVFIFDIAVNPRAQRTGVGRALITRLLADAAHVGIDIAFVPADNDDEHALDFYRALGGRPAAVTIFEFDTA